MTSLSFGPDRRSRPSAEISPEEAAIPDADQESPSPAELFERFFGPSIFEPWTEVLLQAASPQPDDRVLDLACATGIVARRVAPRIGEEGRVVGLDIDPGMLAVARRCAASEGVSVEWREGAAEELPLGDDSFELALCQQGIQFFSDPPSALREVRRVLTDGGRMALNVWQPLERHPVYRSLMEAEARHLDADLDVVATPFTFGGADRLRTLVEDAGFEEIEIGEHTLDVEFREPETFVRLTVMAGAAVVPELAPDDAAERDALIDAVTRDCSDVLERHRDGDRLRFPTPNYIATARA